MNPYPSSPWALHCPNTRPGLRLALRGLILGLLISTIPLQDALAQQDAATVSRIHFTDVTASSGLDFEHFNAASAEKYMIETMGSGCAWLDYDGDGWLDAFLVNGGPTPKVRPPSPVRHALFHNRGDGTFHDVTEAAGVGGTEMYGMGAAVADYDNDGDPDFFLSGYPYSQLYRNDGDGTFSEIAREVGLRHVGMFASSAGWLDYDNDGYLDLLVLNYLDWTYEKDRYCGPKPGYRAYCDPDNFSGVSPTLYRNNGEGSFTDVTRETGLYNDDGKGLGLTLADFDNDGWIDIFIANDGVRNFYYRNQGNGRFEDLTYESALGFSEDGKAEAGMGTDAADYNGDGLLDIFVTHLDYELHRLYRNLGNHNFEDATRKVGLSKGLNRFSGFGTRFVDLDQDSWPDLVQINGHILDNIQEFHPGVTYAEEAQVHRNTGGAFEDVTGQFGGPLLSPRVGRGLCLGDYDNDGDLDLLISNNGEKAELIRNDASGSHWIAFKLVGRQSNRDAIGTQVTLFYQKERRFDQVKGGTSYLSTGDLRLFFGLGSHAQIDRVEVRWPSGVRQVLENLSGDRFHEIQEPPASVVPEPQVIQ